ncbi:MAG TPA: RNA polymerase sigma factor SigZ [Bacteroidales bacterium]|nr:RNA polymerase sigma factor SigZ [Bacteroidales bacterium]
MTQGDNIEKTWEIFRHGLKSFILSKVRNEADADDIMQDVFIRMHDNVGKLNDSSKIKPWLYQITRNLITDYFRKKNSELRDYRDQIVVKQRPGKFMDEAVSDMIRMMDKLSPEYCEALCMTEIEGISQKEYALKKGLSYSGAKSRIQRARVMLRDMLLDCCHYQFDKYGTVFNIEPACCRCCPPGKK